MAGSGASYNADLRRIALDCQLAGGDDYELCFTAPSDQHLAIRRIAAELELPLWCIGEMVENSVANPTANQDESPAGKVTVFDPEGQPIEFDHQGFDHFA